MREKKQKYFLLPELGELDETQKKNLIKLAPVIDVFQKSIDNFEKTDLGDLGPVSIRFSEDAKKAYLCMSNFAEGTKIDHFGDLIEVSSWPSRDGFYRFNINDRAEKTNDVVVLEECLTTSINRRVKKLTTVKESIIVRDVVLE